MRNLERLGKRERKLQACHRLHKTSPGSQSQFYAQLSQIFCPLSIHRKEAGINGQCMGTTWRVQFAVSLDEKVELPPLPSSGSTINGLERPSFYRWSDWKSRQRKDARKLGDLHIKTMHLDSFALSSAHVATSELVFFLSKVGTGTWWVGLQTIEPASSNQC